MPSVYFIPFLSALIGWLTNKIAIKMLFYPKNPIFGIQGLIPKRQKEIAKKIGDIVERELLSSDDIVNNVNTESVYALISSTVDRVVDEEFSLVKAFVGQEVIDGYKAKIAKSILSSLKNDDFDIKEVVSVSEIIENKIISFDLDRLENIIKEVAKREFAAIEVCGAILGFIIGCLQLLFI